MNPVMRGHGAALACSISILAGLSWIGQSKAAELVGRAILPAATFAPGPTSGQLITGTNGQSTPFSERQPVQGISAILPAPRPGSFLVLADNGFGAKNNSPDFVLRVYGVYPEFKTAEGGSGIVQAANVKTGAPIGATVTPQSYFQLNDPKRQSGFAIVAEQSTYPTTTIPVDPLIQRDRLLTGGDFDLESFRQGRDRTFWFGDEFGPFLLHTDATGTLLEPPFQVPNLLGIGGQRWVQSPDNPLLGNNKPNLPRSRGFEGMALNASRTKLYPMLEGPLDGDGNRRRLLIYEFDLRTRKFTNRTFSYIMENTTERGQAVGDLTAINDHEFLIIERDGLQGDPQNPAFTNPAKFKKLYKIDLRQKDSQGGVKKELLVDLLNIPDPRNIGGNGTKNGIFTFPFVTIESFLPLDESRVLIVNDNNFPSSVGRTPGQPDNTEFIVVKLDQTLNISEGHENSTYWKRQFPSHRTPKVIKRRIQRED
jgi:hypothetical protein